MTPQEILLRASTPRTVLALQNDGSFVYIELASAVAPDEMRRLERENGFRFYESCNEEEQSRMLIFMLDELAAGRNPNLSQ